MKNENRNYFKTRRTMHLDVQNLLDEDGLTFEEFAAKVQIADAGEMKSPKRRKGSAVDIGLGAEANNSKFQEKRHKQEEKEQIKEQSNNPNDNKSSLNNSRRTPLFKRKTATVHFSAEFSANN